MHRPKRSRAERTDKSPCPGGHAPSVSLPVRRYASHRLLVTGAGPVRDSRPGGAHDPCWSRRAHPDFPHEPPSPDPQRAHATRRLNRKSVPRWARRLLLVPAAALVLIGAPALAIDQPCRATRRRRPSRSRSRPEPDGRRRLREAGRRSTRPTSSASSGRATRPRSSRSRRATPPATGRRCATSARPTPAPDAGRPTRARSRRAGRLATDPVAVDGASDVRVTVAERHRERRRRRGRQLATP